MAILFSAQTTNRRLEHGRHSWRGWRAAHLRGAGQREILPRSGAHQCQGPMTASLPSLTGYWLVWRQERQVCIPPQADHSQARTTAAGGGHGATPCSLACLSRQTRP
jgi:hypothetical protein